MGIVTSSMYSCLVLSCDGFRGVGGCCAASCACSVVVGTLLMLAFAAVSVGYNYCYVATRSNAIDNATKPDTAYHKLAYDWILGNHAAAAAARRAADDAAPQFSSDANDTRLVELMMKRLAARGKTANITVRLLAKL